MKKMKGTIPSLLLLVCRKHSNFPGTYFLGLESDSDDEGPVDRTPVQKPASPVQAQDSSDDEGPVDSGPVVSDFDLMMQKRKEENRMKRMKNKKNEGQFISDVDDSINSMMNRMKEAADADKGDFLSQNCKNRRSNLRIEHKPTTRLP